MSKSESHQVFDMRAANKLAYECARAIRDGFIGERSAISDALLDYLRIGNLDGPPDVPTWMDYYERANPAR
jgi:hypothetical protein